MPDSRILDLTEQNLTGGDSLEFARPPNLDFRVTGTGLKAFTDQNAAGVPFTPTGGISATDVQAAIAELDTEKISDITGEPLGALSDVTITAPANTEVLTYNGSIWVNAAVPGGGGGEANTGANVGTGAGLIFRDKVGATLNFKSILTAQAAMNVVNNANEVQLSVDVATPGNDGLMPGADKTKLDGIETGAQLNKNSFERIQVSGQGDVIADNDQDALTYVAGPGMVITTTPGTDTITFTAEVAETIALDDLTDVTVTTPVNGHVLEYNGSQWVNVVNPGAPVTSVFTRTGAVVAASGDYTAAQVTNTPAGFVAATDVQAAINEIDSEKPQISTEDTLAGQMQIAVVSALPGTPDANTVYFITT